MERPALLESWAARLGVAVLVGLSIWLGFNYWRTRSEEQLAWITVGVELIAFAGIAVARSQADWRWRWACVALTILAASWCGFTMFQKISDDGHTRAVAVAEQTLSYQTASQDLRAASIALRAALAAPRPESQGPLTITAWDAAQAATVARLTHARDDAIVRVNAALPAVALDWIAVARGVGVEIIKLFGFAAFGAWRRQPSQVSSQVVAKKRRWGWGALFGATALAATPAYAGQTPEIQGVSHVAQPDPVVLFPPTDKKSQAFAMRGRFSVDDIADALRVHRSTIYRWFADRDRQMKAAAA